MRACFFSILGILLPPTALAFEAPKASLSLTSPRDYQVFQRRTLRQGNVTVAGRIALGQDEVPGEVAVEARLAGPSLEGSSPGSWQPLPFDVRRPEFLATLPIPAGGWYRLELRVRSGGKTLADAPVEHVGVGEVFVVAGQSNAANHGAGHTKTRSGFVASFDGGGWALASDPQPGASGRGGSFMATFGDLIHARYKVPVGITAVSVGATSVRQWLPAGTRVTVPPTRLSGLVPAGPGQWEASGELFDRLATRLLQLGPYGCRAVLWHQGESDANQALVGRTLPGGQYRDSLERIIRKSRERAGWEVPWFVAQASYHSPRDPGSPDIRAAQEALWVDGIALEGPDTDALTGDLRDNGGRGVHFSAKGLQVHGERWAEKVGAHLDKVLAKP